MVNLPDPEMEHLRAENENLRARRLREIKMPEREAADYVSSSLGRVLGELADVWREHAAGFRQTADRANRSDTSEHLAAMKGEGLAEGIEICANALSVIAEGLKVE
jgi:hypothetical protein